MKRLVSYFLEHSLLVNLITVFVFTVGIFSFFRLHREAFPNVSYDRVVITTLYPGADPRSVEKRITLPIERELKGVNDLKEVRSISIEGRSVLIVTVESSVDDTDRVINDIQRALDQVDDFPADLEDRPMVMESNTKSSPIIELSVAGDLSLEELVVHARRLEKRILDFDEVADVVRKGWREREIWVEADPEKLAAAHFSLGELIPVLRGANVNIPGGLLKSRKGESILRIDGEFESAEDVARVILRANDASQSLSVADVARVRDAFESEEILHRTNGRQAINLTVLKKERADAIHLTDRIKETVDQFQREEGNGLEISLVNDFSFYIKRRLKVLWQNGLLGFVFIVVLLVFFLDFKTALITALGVPFALCITFFGMQVFGMSLNLLTMFGLITVLGMLVDDAIVVAENIHRYRETGMSLKEACVAGTIDVWKPVTTSVLTTMAAFLPLMFMSGVMGKFVLYIPLMVIIALAASLGEAFFILPAHVLDWSSEPGRKRAKRFKDRFERFAENYSLWLRRMLERRYRVAAFFGAVLLSGVVLYRMIPFQLFPSKGIEMFFIRAEAPVGTPVEETARRFAALEKLVATLPKNELEDYVLQVGIQQNDPNDPFTERFSHLGQIQVFLTPITKRDRETPEILESLRRKWELESGVDPAGLGKPEFSLMKGGPPAGKPVALRLRGENLAGLEWGAHLIRRELSRIPGVQSAKVDQQKGKGELLFQADPVRLARSGLTLQDVGMAVRASFEGIAATSIRKTDEEILVRVRFPETAQYDIASLKKIVAPNRSGRLIHLSEVGDFMPQTGWNAIRHFDRDRAVTVLAEIDETQQNVLELAEDFEPSLDKIRSLFPELRIDFTGEFEETQESLAGLKQAFFLGALLIFILLAVQFNSLWQPFVVMSAIPLGLVGVLFAFLIHGEPKSFLALMGMVGLAGVVVNNGIILVDFINESRRRGVGKLDSILEAARLRLRPVVLTSLTTVMGLFSLAYGLWGSDPFLKPMALAFVWGILFATVLTLVAVPCFHAIADDFLGTRA